MDASLKPDLKPPAQIAASPCAVEACCPQCDGPVRRIHRLASDRAISLIHRVGRYQCRNHGCSWQGLISLRNPAIPVPVGIRRAALMLLLLLSTAAVAGFIGIRQFAPQFSGVRLGIPATTTTASDWPTSAPAAPGITADVTRSVPGERSRLPATTLGVPLRSCVWAGGGRLPYVGTFSEALVAAGLPADAIVKLVRMRDRELVTDRLEISHAGVRSSNGDRQFDSTARAMTLGVHICMEVRLSPAEGVVETADLLEVIDSADKRHLVMVTASGANVGVLDELPAR